jgi:hypothetical protein
MSVIARQTGAAVFLTIVLAACGGGGGGGGGGGSSGSPSPSIGTSAANELTVIVDRGPTVAGNVNQPYVSVTVCAPGSTSNCQTIDHVLVDTGSTGLRLVADAVNVGVLAGMQGQQDSSGQALFECQAFVVGYTWGSVRLADVKLGDLTASNLPIHVIGDPMAPSVPTDCSSRGSGVAMNTVETLGAKGILGIDSFIEDCPGCVQASTYPAYFTCPGGTCATVQVSAARQVQNPVAALATDNNGVLLDMPAVAASGATNPTGSLILGVGTRSNNALGSASIFDLDGYGEFWTRYNGQWLFAFVDSGSNGLFFNDGLISNCANPAGFYCPGTTLALSALVEGATNNTQATIAFGVADAHTLMTSYPGTAYSNLAGGWPGASTYFDWGMPFFYGRRVFYAINGRSTPGGTGPYIAF